MRLRIVTWNIHKGIGGVDRRYRLERVIGMLSSLAPDVALLQEVASGLPRAGEHDQLHILSTALAMPYMAYSPQHAFAKGGGYGNAILSRWPLSAVEQLDLTIGTRKKRGALQAKARVRIGRHSRTVVFFSLHLGLAGSERARQIARFLESHPFQGHHYRTPIVLCGDFNDLWGTLGPRFLTPSGFVRAGRLESTFPAWLPVRPLDGIFVRGDARISKCHVPKGQLARMASDHLPIVAELELGAADSR